MRRLSRWCLLLVVASGSEDKPIKPVMRTAPEETLRGQDDQAKSTREDFEDEEDEEEEDALPAEGERQLSRVMLEEVFEKIDLDKDGKLSLSDITAFWKTTRRGMLFQSNEQDMETMDSNKDKKVSLEEFYEEGLFRNQQKQTADDTRRKTFALLHEAKFKAADKNADGFLDEHELPHAVYGETHDDIVRLMAAHDLKLKDKDGDSKLDVTEFNDLGEDPILFYDEHKEEKDAKTAEEAAAPEKETAEEFKKLDTDTDGKLSLDELVPWESGVYHLTHDMKKLFEVCDGDGDSQITLKDINKHMHELDGSAAFDHLYEWAEHYEDMLARQHEL